MESKGKRGFFFCVAHLSLNNSLCCWSKILRSFHLSLKIQRHDRCAIGSKSKLPWFPYNRGWETQPNNRVLYGFYIPIIRIPKKRQPWPWHRFFFEPPFFSNDTVDSAEFWQIFHHLSNAKQQNPDMTFYDIWPNEIIFHQPRFPWNKRISLTKPPFGVRSGEVAIIWPNDIANPFVYPTDVFFLNEAPNTVLARD